MVKISPLNLLTFTSYNQYIGKKYPLRGQGFQNEDTSYACRGGFKWKSTLRARSLQGPIFEFPFVCFLKTFFVKFKKSCPKNLLIKMKDLSFLFQQKENSKIGPCDDLALGILYNLKPSRHAQLVSSF